MRLLSSRRFRTPSVALACLSVLLLAAAGCVYLLIYRQGTTAEHNAQSLLAQYEQALAQNPVTAAPANTHRPPVDSAAQPAALASAPAEAPLNLSGYTVLGKLRIAAIGLELPVLAQTTARALQLSVCYYDGALPGESGTMVIAGHNYANGAHFGRLDQLKKGDTVLLDAPSGEEYTYTVSRMEVVKPDDTEALSAHPGDHALALLTCTRSGNRRLIVWCTGS